jgi:predicted Zn-dependent protease
MGRHLAALLAVTLTAPAAGAFDLSNIDLNRIGKVLSQAEDAVTEVGEERELELGAEVAARLLGAAPLVRDDHLQRYVNRVGMWVAGHGERSHLPWRFAVVDTPDINAFAAPGGYIFITRGLFQALRDEAELAGVLGHEVVHVLRRHHLEAIQKNARLGVAKEVASMIAADKGYDIDRWAGLGMEIYARGLDKKDEFEADLLGTVLAARAGYHPEGLRTVLLTLANMNPAEGSLALLFKTHPPPADRLHRLAASLDGRLHHLDGLPRPRERLVARQAALEGGP